MKILTDLHTHTNRSAHAYSTIYENVTQAAKIGLELIAITDHAPTASEDVHLNHFSYLPIFISREVEGVTVLRGIEVNILDETGKLDIENKLLDKLDIVIASCHENVFEPNEEQFLQTYTAVINNPRVDIIGHLCRNEIYSGFDDVIRLAMANNKLIEINNLSFKNRKPERREGCKILMQKCFEHGAKVVVNSDAHFCTHVGDLADITAYLENLGYPEHLIINRNKAALFEFLGKDFNS
jgi:putative hydrolase